MPFTYQIKATNAPMTFTATGLPPGLTLDAETGTIRGVLSLSAQTGLVPVTIGAVNDGGPGTAVLALKVLPPLPAITSSLKETATAGRNTGTPSLHQGPRHNTRFSVWFRDSPSTPRPLLYRGCSTDRWPAPRLTGLL